MTEADIMREIQIEATRIGCRLFRNNQGMGWTGNVQHHGGTVVITNPRPLHAGLVDGAGDLIGLLPVKIGNRKIAIFLSDEVKTRRGTLRAAQKTWLASVQHNGGCGLVSRSVDEFLQGIEDFKANLGL